ncbi:MAG: Druantia anti-phage system protein DruA, partial [Caulobacteraceae bacterium]
MSGRSGVVTRPFDKEAALKRAIRRHFKTLGFTKNTEGELVLPGEGKTVVRQLHRAQRRSRLQLAQPFLERALPKTLAKFAEGSELDVSRIRLALRVVKSETSEADLFRVATMTWSVPVSVGFGRRMRYLVWDEGHDRLAGVIALGDPVYNLSVRDKAIGWTVHDRAERLVGVLDAYVLGAVPPYSFLLGGKAVACLVRSREVFADFQAKYGGSVGVISRLEKSAKLLAVTTTSSMGRSSVYNR